MSAKVIGTWNAGIIIAAAMTTFVLMELCCLAGWYVAGVIEAVFQASR